MLEVGEHGAGDVVHGEYVGFADTGPVLETLDAIEEFVGYASEGNEYLRTLVEVDTGHSTKRLAWTYIAANRLMIGERIESGCWRTHRGISPEEYALNNAGENDAGQAQADGTYSKDAHSA